MKIVYFGTSDFAVPALRVLAPHVILVVSQPDRPAGRGMKLSAVKQVALELDLPVETPEKARDPEFVERIANLHPDVLVVAAYGQILSVKLLETATRGGVNLHGSILPKYRGAAPIQRAIFAGESETGVTLMQMAKGMDTGDMIDITQTSIGDHETYGELQTRLSELAAVQIGEWINRIVAGEYPRIEQDHEKATHAAKIDRAETELRFDMPDAYLRFRAFTPNPSCFLNTVNGRLKLVAARTVTGHQKAMLGEIISVSPLVVHFAQGAIELTMVQPEGKVKQSGSDWANGQRLTVGNLL
jgi:methionyl-tRNA formyltransferase